MKSRDASGAGRAFGTPYTDLLNEAKSQFSVSIPSPHDSFSDDVFSPTIDSQAWAVDPSRLRDEPRVILGFVGGAHLGDSLCVTALVKSLHEEWGKEIYLARHRSVYHAFANNPYIAGYENEGRIGLTAPTALSPGHVIQRLQAAFGVRIAHAPRPDVYLTDEELAFAWSVRSSLPRNRPVALFSTGGISHPVRSSEFPSRWNRLANIVDAGYTVVQPVIRNVKEIEAVTRMTEAQKARWRPDEVLDNSFVLEGLTVRQYFALFAVADLFVGVSSGGSHLAAAFGLPSLIALSRRHFSRLRFPAPNYGTALPFHSFLYPSHSFVCLDEYTDP